MHYVIQNAKTLFLICCLNFGISMYRKIQEFIVYLLLGLLLSIVVSSSFGQQNQNTLQQEVEALKNRVSELEGKLQTVENVEKMELAAKLAEAEARLINTEFGKLKLELKDSNQQWLRNWIFIILGFLSVVGIALWSRLTKKMDDLITTEVQKRVNRFQEAVEEVDTLKFDLKDAVGQVSILKGQLSILNKEHAASVLERFRSYRPEHYPEQVKELEEQAILDVFSDETRHLEFRCKAAEVLTSRGSTRLVSPILKCLDSYIDSDFDWEQNYRTQHLLCDLVHLIGYVRTTETYETLKRFLEQLLSEKPEVKRYILTSITFSLVYVSSELNTKDSVPVIRNAIPILDIYPENENALKDLVEYFAKFQEHEGIKEILTNGLTEGIPDLEKQCLDLLKERHSNFVKEWKAQKETTNTKSEDSA